MNATSQALGSWGPRLERGFFARDARVVARALLGARLVHEVGPGDLRVARIVETEAYRGAADPACHARFGRTTRTESLFAPPGHAYLFLVYGLHVCFNVTCLREGAGHAVLVRAVEPLRGVSLGQRTDGPGKLTWALGLARRHDGLDLCAGGPLALAARVPGADGRAAPRVGTGPRIGVGYAGAAAELPLRFWDAASDAVSRPPRAAVGLGRGPGHGPPRRGWRAAVVLGDDP